jgi:hypothetical protein
MSRQVSLQKCTKIFEHASFTYYKSYTVFLTKRALHAQDISGTVSQKINSQSSQNLARIEKRLKQIVNDLLTMARCSAYLPIITKKRECPSLKNGRQKFNVVDPDPH